MGQMAACGWLLSAEAATHLLDGGLRDLVKGRVASHIGEACRLLFACDYTLQHYDQTFLLRRGFLGPFYLSPLGTGSMGILWVCLYQDRRYQFAWSDMAHTKPCDRRKV
jgi:hypothetical protein